MTHDGLEGLVLAGGEGRRLGMPKASAEVAGTTLAERAVEVLRQRCSRVIVASREDVVLPVLDAEVVLDDGGARSAVTGLVSGLSALGAPQVLVLACDLVVASALLDRLVAADGPAAVALDDGGPQPLCARYDRVRALAASRQILDSGDLRARQLVHLLQATLVPVEPGELVNVNTPDDLARAAQVMR